MARIAHPESLSDIVYLSFNQYCLNSASSPRNNIRNILDVFNLPVMPEFKMINAKLNIIIFFRDRNFTPIVSMRSYIKTSKI